jgi:hypothetical protein
MLARVAALLSYECAPLVLFAGSAAIALGTGCLLNSSFTWADERDYYTFAANLFAHSMYSADGHTLTAYRPPGYAFFLSLWFYLGSGLAFLRRVNLGLWLFSAVLTFKVTEALVGRRAAMASVALVLAYPVLLYTATFLYPQILGADLFLIFLYLHVTYREQTVASTAAEGLVFGVLLLTLPFFAFALPAFLVAIMRRAGSRALLLVALAMVPVSLWSVRNYLAFGRVVLIGTEAGEAFMVGNSQHTAAMAALNADLSSEKAAANALKLDEAQRDHFFRGAALRWIAHHPAQWAALYAQKFLNWFNFRNTLATTEESSRLKWAVLFVTWYPLLLLALCRVVFDSRLLSEDEICLCVAYMFCAAAYAVFFTRIRYRVPFDYIVIILAAGFCGRHLQGLSHISRPTFVASYRTATESETSNPR